MMINSTTMASSPVAAWMLSSEVVPLMRFKMPTSTNQVIRVAPIANPTPLAMG